MLRVAKPKPIRLLFRDDGGGIVRLWALLNHCAMVVGGVVFYSLLGVVSGFLSKSSSAMKSP